MHPLSSEYHSSPSITANGQTTTFVYDGEGRRVKKVGGSKTSVYIGKLYVCEFGQCAKLIWAGNQRIAIKQVTSGSVSYFHPDHLATSLRQSNTARFHPEGPMPGTLISRGRTTLSGMRKGVGSRFVTHDMIDESTSGHAWTREPGCAPAEIAGLLSGI
ncbi:MAG: hypothetical protein AB1555_19930, partial [Nitrospirota bacterium]